MIKVFDKIQHVTHVRTRKIKSLLFVLIWYILLVERLAYTVKLEDKEMVQSRSNLDLVAK